MPLQTVALLSEGVVIAGITEAVASFPRRLDLGCCVSVDCRAFMRNTCLFVCQRFPMGDEEWFAQVVDK